MKEKKGQVLVGVVVMLLVLAIIIPAMVTYVQNEAKWSVREAQTTTAFHLAEGAIERGYQKVTESTNTWNNIQQGGATLASACAGFMFDTKFGDLSGGYYTISLSSGPQRQQVTIIGIGRDILNKEVRAIKAVYTNDPMGGPINSGGGVNITGCTAFVEWGRVISPKPIVTCVTNNKHPQFYSSSSISPFDSSPIPPNTDGVQWWTYRSDIPTGPALDFDAFKSSAQATGTYFTTCGSVAINDLRGYTYYYDCPNPTTDAVRIDANSGNTYLVGNLIVNGTLNIDDSAGDSSSRLMTAPFNAWRQYGNDWAYYRAQFGDGNAPIDFPGLNSGYTQAAATGKNVANVGAGAGIVSHGFVYVGKDLNLAFSGGGATIVWGAVYVLGNANIGADFYVFYDDQVTSNIFYERLVLSRASWQDLPGWGWRGP